MAKFIKGNELNSEIEKIIEQAESSIVLISPYIKLHDRYASALLTKKEKPKLKITVLFGKNENDLSKSMKKEDFDFFKQFPNIEILYEKRLHAKYYSNEVRAILTSMNLYGYSQNNNIETGILMESSFKGIFTGENSIDMDSWEYFETVINQAEVLFLKEPVFEKSGLLSSKKYVNSNIITDTLSNFFSNKKYEKKIKKNVTKTKHIGYCIRTGVEIPYNREKPFSIEAFKSWNKYKDENYQEKFCHYSGEASNGNTSFKYPILSKNWKKAMIYEKKKR